MEQRLELFAAAQVRLRLLEGAGDGQRAVGEREGAGGVWDAFADDVRDARRFDGGLARWGLAGGPEVAERLLALVGAVRLVVGDVFVVGAEGGAVVGHCERGAAGVGELGEDVVGDAALAGFGGVVSEDGSGEGGGESECEGEGAEGAEGQRGESSTGPERCAATWRVLPPRCCALLSGVVGTLLGLYTKSSGASARHSSAAE